ncbi:MAG: ArsA family ATPase [Kofleriaceae bacterium]
MLHYVTGKGGVGKSTIAAAIAIAAASRGARVLGIELGPRGGLARALAARPEITVMQIDGAAAVGEYLTRRMHLGRFVRPILEHPLYAAFVEAAPGLRELVAIGKVRDEYVLQRRWDVVVVDAGASGHALEHLRMPSAAELAFRSGLVHREAARNAELLRDPSRCAIHVVAMPEEMPLAEAAQTVETLRGLELAIGRVIVNRCVPPPPRGIEVPAGDAVLAAVLGRALDRARAQESAIATFQQRLGLPVLRAPWLPIMELSRHARLLAASIAELA